MTDFERRLADQLRDRADATNVSLDLDAIRSHQASAPPPPTRSRHAHTRAMVAIVASAAVVVVGLVALDQSRSDTADPAASPSPQPTGVSQPTAGPYGSLPTAGPALNDHWHIAYGVNVCGEWVQLTGDLEERDAQGRLTNEDFIATGIHSHDDGLIHVHPFTEAGAGSNATLGVFFDNYGIELGDEGLIFDPAAGNETLRSAYERCVGADPEPVVVVWPDIDEPDEKVVVDRQLAGVPLGADRMAIAIAIGSDPHAVGLPPSTAHHLLSADDDGAASSPLPEVPSSLGAVPPTVGRLDLDDVPPGSVPVVLSEYLFNVQLAVRQEVGDDVFGGAVAAAAATDDVTITIYGTDAERVADAVDHIAVDARERITVAESRFSVSELERFGDEAQRRLDAEDIEAYVWIRFGLDAVQVDLVTPAGRPDSAIEDSARIALRDLPVSISFSAQ